MASKVTPTEIVYWDKIIDLATEIDACSDAMVSNKTVGRPDVPDCTKTMSENTWGEEGVSILMKDISTPWPLNLPLQAKLYQRLEFAYAISALPFVPESCPNSTPYDGKDVFLYNLYKSGYDFPIFHSQFLVKDPTKPVEATLDDIGFASSGSDRNKNVHQLIESQLGNIIEWWKPASSGCGTREDGDIIAAELYFVADSASCPCGGTYRFAFAVGGREGRNGNGNGYPVGSEWQACPFCEPVYEWPLGSLSSQRTYTLTEPDWTQMIPETGASTYIAPPLGCCAVPVFPRFGDHGAGKQNECSCTLFHNGIFLPSQPGGHPPHTVIYKAKYSEYLADRMAGHSGASFGVWAHECTEYERVSIYELWPGVCGSNSGPAHIRVTPLRFLYTDDNKYIPVPDDFDSPLPEEVDSKLKVITVWLPTAVISTLTGKFVPAIRKRWYDMMYYKLRFIVGHYLNDGSKTVGVTWNKTAEELFAKANKSQASMWLAELGWLDGGDGGGAQHGVDSPFGTAPYDTEVDVEETVKGGEFVVAEYSYTGRPDNSPTTPDPDGSGHPKSGEFTIPPPDIAKKVPAEFIPQTGYKLNATLTVDDWGTLNIKRKTGKTYTIDMSKGTGGEPADPITGGHSIWTKALPAEDVEKGDYTYSATQENVPGVADNINALSFTITVTVPDIVIKKKAKVCMPPTCDAMEADLNSNNASAISSSPLGFPKAPEEFRWGEKYMEQFICVMNAMKNSTPATKVTCPGSGKFNNSNGGICSEGDTLPSDCGYLLCDNALPLPWEGGCENKTCAGGKNPAGAGMFLTHAYTYNTLVNILDFINNHKISEHSLQFQLLSDWKFCYRTGKKSGNSTYKFWAPGNIPPCLPKTATWGNPKDKYTIKECENADCKKKTEEHIVCEGTFSNTAADEKTCKEYNDMVNNGPPEDCPFTMQSDVLSVDVAKGRSPIHIMMWQTFLAPPGESRTLKITIDGIENMLCMPKDYNGRNPTVTRLCGNCGYISGNIYLCPVDSTIADIEAFQVAPYGGGAEPEICESAAYPLSFPWNASTSTVTNNFEISGDNFTEGQYRYTVIVSMCIDHDGCGMAGGGPYSDYKEASSTRDRPSEPARGKLQCMKWTELLERAMAGSSYKTGAKGQITLTLS